MATTNQDANESTSILDAINAPYELTDAQRADIAALSAPKAGTVVTVTTFSNGAPGPAPWSEERKERFIREHVAAILGSNNCD